MHIGTPPFETVHIAILVYMVWSEKSTLPDPMVDFKSEPSCVCIMLRGEFDLNRAHVLGKDKHGKRNQPSGLTWLRRICWDHTDIFHMCAGFS